VGKPGFFFLGGGEVMSRITYLIKAGELESLENLGHEIQSIGAFLARLELSMIKGEGREAVWNFGVALDEKGKHIITIVEDIYSHKRAKKETKNSIKILRPKNKKEG
jgi:hypothetical protein